MTTKPEAPRKDVTSTPDEPPPFLGSWRNVYLLLLGELALLTAVFYALTRYAS